MSDDILAVLRRMVEVEPQYPCINRDVLQAAAEEIERLRALLSPEEKPNG